MRLVTLLFLALLATAAHADTKPEEVLDEYFKVLTSRNVDKLPDLISNGDKARIKELMDAAMLGEGRSSIQLQRRMFGQPVDENKIKETSADHYILALAEEILQAAEMQRFFVDNRRVLGRIDEANDMVHYVVRIFMHQDSVENSNLLVYTLVEERGRWKMKVPPILAQTLAVIEAMTRRQGNSLD